MDVIKHRISIKTKLNAINCYIHNRVIVSTVKWKFVNNTRYSVWYNSIRVYLYMIIVEWRRRGLGESVLRGETADQILLPTAWYPVRSAWCNGNISFYHSQFIRSLHCGCRDIVLGYVIVVNRWYTSLTFLSICWNLLGLF